MASPLVIPGVQVRTAFEPAFPPLSATGILGVVGVADRGTTEATPVGSMTEFVELFGPASLYTMPEVRTALAEGVSRVVVARTAPGRGAKARITFRDDEGEFVATLIARAEGAWGNRLSVQATQIRTLSGQAVKYVNLDIFSDGEKIESFTNLTMDETSPNYLFDRINEGSNVVVAVDPRFEAGLPRAVNEAPFVDLDARAAFALARRGNTDTVRVEARRRGRAGNLIAVRIREGRSGLTLRAADNSDCVDIRARRPGAEGTQVRISITAAGEDQINVVVTPQGGGPARTVGPFGSVDDLVAELATDPAVEAVGLGDRLPAVLPPTQLAGRVDIDVLREGQDPRTYDHLGTLGDIEAIDDRLVQFSRIGTATELPDPIETPLSGGRDRGAALALLPAEGEPPLVELLPAGEEANLRVTIESSTSTIDGATPVVNISISIGDREVERFVNLTMDPDDEHYLPEVFEATSELVRARDLFVRSRTTSFPRHQIRPQPLADGESPRVDDYRDALERLEQAEEVDLVIASAAGQLADDQVISVQQAVVSHCAKMSTVARNRIGLGSAHASETGDPRSIVAHANDVRSEHFILCAPAGVEAGVAGLLGRQQYFESPTFKTIGSPGAEPGDYTDSQLEQLISGNVLTVNRRRGRGVIVIKGLLTSGRQVSVQRTANKAVRDVKVIADNYVGRLNNQGARNALKQQITALFLQMERDSAIVPSTDGSDPSFKVDVYSSQADFSAGIVRVDIAIRPVRAIDYIYATILVQN